MTTKKRLLIIGPSFKRLKNEHSVRAFDRYDGVFFRIAKKYITCAKDVRIVIMLDDLTLVDSSTQIPYVPPEGSRWDEKKVLNSIAENVVQKNHVFLERRLRNKNYSEIFMAMGKRYAHALPDMSKYGVKVIFPANGGLGPKAAALKEWFNTE